MDRGVGLWAPGKKKRGFLTRFQDAPDLHDRWFAKHESEPVGDFLLCVIPSCQGTGGCTLSFCWQFVPRHPILLTVANTDLLRFRCSQSNPCQNVLVIDSIEAG